MTGGSELFANQRIRLAAAGWCHLAVVAEDGAVYTCGRGDYGQLGLGDGQPRRRLTRVPQALFAGSRVVMVSCGGVHTMAVTAVGHAWTCGGNEYGQLGVGDTANRLGFTRVDAGQLGGARIVMAACGLNHSVVVSAEGGVWTFGCGDCGRLGHNDEQDRLVPTLLEAQVFEGSSKIVTVAAGGFHTMAVGESGALWAWGWGSYGQLGLGDTNNRLVPTLVGTEEVFGGSKVRTVACGDVHTLAVTEAGELWTWGYGAQGRLGLNDEQDRLVPTLLTAEVFEHSKIVTVAAGGFHTMAVDKSGRLWTWGAGFSGQLGLGDTSNRMVPTVVGAEEVFGGSKVRTVACGHDHTLVVTEVGELWAWGRGSHGRLGLNDRGDSLVPRRVDPQHFGNDPIAAVAAGELHSAAVTKRGALYTWGRSEVSPTSTSVMYNATFMSGAYAKMTWAPMLK
jgi:alpha-tubulin suppressor-like RCC1 family protein